MATITYTDNCPLCSVHGVEIPLMQEPPSEELFCGNGHKFPAEEPTTSLTITTTECLPAPYVPIVSVDDGLSTVAESSTVAVAELEFPVGTINPQANGDGSITVRIPELNLVNLRARSEELSETPGEVFQRALDWAFENQWFESIW